MFETLVLDLILLFLVLIVAIATVLVRNLLSAAALLSIYSLLMALVWSNMYALDVAFTEAAVGAGISTILMIGALVITGTKEKAPKVLNWPALVIVALVGVALGYGTLDMPPFGERNVPVHNRVYDVYVEQNLGKPDPQVPGQWDRDVARDPRTSPLGHDYVTAPGHQVARPTVQNAAKNGDFSHHAPNLVTPVIVSYRGYDTMFETTVIFTAGISVILLLRRRQQTPAPATAASKTPAAGSPQPPKEEVGR
ncbi:MAG: hydrogen gas-evolving membrane-bound hydrogenase subunit E [Planctomycetota bacterium]